MPDSYPRPWSVVPNMLDKSMYAIVDANGDVVVPECSRDPSVADLIVQAVNTAPDACRYQWLRSRDLDTIVNGGVFAGMTPENVVMNGDTLDRAIDDAMKKG